MATPNEASRTSAIAFLLTAKRNSVRMDRQVAAAPAVPSITAASSIRERRCRRTISSCCNDGVSVPRPMASDTSSSRSATRARRPANTFSSAAMPERRKTGVSAT